MSDFGSCDFGAITPELLIRSLLSGIQAGASCGVRTKSVSGVGLTMSSPVPCTTAEDLMSLFQRSLVIADDGYVAIRTTTTTSNNGAGIETCPSCQSGWTQFEMLGAMFSMDQNGNVYLNLINIT